MNCNFYVLVDIYKHHSFITFGSEAWLAMSGEFDDASYESRNDELADMIESKLKSYNDRVESRIVDLEDKFVNLLHKLEISLQSGSNFSTKTSRDGSSGDELNLTRDKRVKDEPNIMNNNNQSIKKTDGDENVTNLKRNTNVKSVDTPNYDSDSDSDHELVYEVRDKFKIPSEDILPIFGKKLSVQRWCDLVSELKASLKWSESETLFVVRCRLSDDAINFWKTLDDGIKSKWHRVKKRFIQRFDDKIKGNVALRQTLKIEMLPTEDLEIFILRFYKEIEATGTKFDERILINLFVNAIHPKSVGNLVSRELDKLESLPEIIQRTRAIWVAEKTNVTETKSVNTLQLTEHEINLIKKWSKGNNRGGFRGGYRGGFRGGYRGRRRGYRSNNQHQNESVKCFSCQQFGHFARDCPEKEESGKEAVAKK